MPDFYPEGDAPRASDQDVRCLHKIVSLLHKMERGLFPAGAPDSDGQVLVGDANGVKRWTDVLSGVVRVYGDSAQNLDGIVLGEGVCAFTTDTDEFRVGNGVTPGGKGFRKCLLSTLTGGAISLPFPAHGDSAVSAFSEVFTLRPSTRYSVEAVVSVTLSGGTGGDFEFILYPLSSGRGIQVLPVGGVTYSTPASGLLSFAVSGSDDGMAFLHKGFFVTPATGSLELKVMIKRSSGFSGSLSLENGSYVLVEEL